MSAVDIGYKSEGVILTAELSIRRSVNPAAGCRRRETDALVLTKEDAEGLILSRSVRVSSSPEADRGAAGLEARRRQVIEVVKVA
jgi:ribosomal protein S1